MECALRSKRAIVSLSGVAARSVSFYAGKATVAEVTKIVRENMDKESRLHTDESRVYWKVGNEMIRHEAVNHGKKEYARGDVMTSTVETSSRCSNAGCAAPTSIATNATCIAISRNSTSGATTGRPLKLTTTCALFAPLKGINGKRLTYQQAHRGWRTRLRRLLSILLR